MSFDEIDLAQLPPSREEAFVHFEKEVRNAYESRTRDDRDNNIDQNGNYDGSYAPEKSYVNAMLAFLDEYDLEADIEDISELSGHNFIQRFDKFKSRLSYLAMRFNLRKNRTDAGSIGTVIMIASTYKSEIGKLLETIRKIVNQEVHDPKKKDKIFAKIAALQSEVDRDRTTIDALFGQMIDLTKTVGECAENLDPLIDKLERVKKLFWDNSEKVEILPKKERSKLITKQEAPAELDDEIPF